MIGELEKLERLIQREERLKQLITTRRLAEINIHKEIHHPLFCFSIGKTDTSHPVLLVVGGVHGLERIGAQLAWSLLKTTIDRLLWDESLRSLFEKIQLIFVPLLNPSGYYLFQRSNGNGVDLMRNAPVESQEKTPFLLGGHFYNNKLPWFRGSPDQLELENQSLFRVFQEQCLSRPCVISLDFHSGFGLKDRLWFPFSFTRKPFNHLPELHSIIKVFEQTHPYHVYQIEPQSHAYLLNGDIWDYFYLEYRKKNPSGVFLPLTLEMGSWSWVKKNPLQIFYKYGAFNPIKEHRIKRTYRRHHLLFSFLLKALYSHRFWSQLDEKAKQTNFQQGINRWYEQ